MLIMYNLTISQSHSNKIRNYDLGSAESQSHNFVLSYFANAAGILVN